MFGIKDLKARVRALELDAEFDGKRYWELWCKHDDLCKFLGVNHYIKTESGYAPKGGPESGD